MPITQYLGKPGTRPLVSRHRIRVAGQELGEKGGKRTRWGGGHRELSPTPALPLRLLDLEREEQDLEWKKQDLEREDRPERRRGREAASQVAGSLWGRSGHPASLSPADVDSPPQPGRVICGVCGGSSASLQLSCQAWLCMQGGPFRKRLGPGPSLATLSPKTEGGGAGAYRSSGPALPAPPQFPHLGNGGRDQKFCLGSPPSPLLTALGEPTLTGFAQGFPPLLQSPCLGGAPLPLAWRRRGKRVYSLGGKQQPQPEQTFPVTHRPGTS